MDRRKFLAMAGAAVMSPVLPLQSQTGVAVPRIPDSQGITRLMAIQRGAMREVHRVTGIPRYQMGRDTWQDQVDAGLSEIVTLKEGQADG